MFSSSSSSSSRKRALKPSETTVAYVHDLSPVKRNRNNTMDYVSMTLQTASSTTVEALLYSPHKRQLFAQSQQSRTPLKLKDHTYTADKSKIVINDMTNVTTPHHSEYSFQYVDITPPAANQDPVSILEVLNNKKEWDNVVVTAKVTQLNKTVPTGKNRLNLSEAILADASASIDLDIWEDNIKQVSIGECFTFRPVQVRVWSGKKKLSTTHLTNITAAVKDDKLEQIPLASGEDGTEVTSLTVKEFLSIQHFNKFLKCPKCNKSTQQRTSKIVNCHRCGVIRADKCIHGMVVKVIVKDSDGKELSIKMGDEVLSSLLKIPEVLALDEDALAEHLLFVNDVKLTYEKSTFLAIAVC